MKGILAALMSSPTIVIVGLNGALQKRFVLPENGVLIPGDVHRAERIQTGVGGKGQDVAITLKCLSSNANIQLSQFVGKGSSGDAVYKILGSLLGSEGLDLTVRVESEMRTCTSIIASDETTEMVEPSGMIQQEEIAKLLDLVEDRAQRKAAGLCIMGSMPPGCENDIYAKMFERTAGPNTLSVIDSVVGIGPLFETIASSPKSGSVIFKVNASELCRLAGVKKLTSEASGIQMDELRRAVKNFHEKQPHAKRALDGLAITDGRHPAFYVSTSKSSDGEMSVFQIPTPSLAPEKQTVFPIGAGDAVAAGTLAAWLYLTNPDENKSLVSAECTDILQQLHHHYDEIDSKVPTEQVAAFAFGLGCGASSCLNEENSVVKGSDVGRLLSTCLTDAKLL